MTQDSSVDMKYMDHLTTVANGDVNVLREKTKSYGPSWKMRGGVGAFMMLARKWDRLEQQLKRADAPFSMDGGRSPGRYDILEHIEADVRDEGVLDDIRDLRRYLMLVEAEMIARGVVELPGLMAHAVAVKPTDPPKLDMQRNPIPFVTASGTRVVVASGDKPQGILRAWKILEVGHYRALISFPDSAGTFEYAANELTIVSSPVDIQY